MDSTAIVGFLTEILYLLIVFGIFIVLAVAKGKQSLINVILALYLALLLSLQFPYYDSLISGAGAETESMVKLVVFCLFAAGSVWLFNRLMPREFDEKAFEGFGMKLIFAMGATVLVMAFSYNALPVTEFVTPGSPIQTLFAPSDYFFWWLLLPLVLLFML